jgi:hypothetical protein
MSSLHLTGYAPPTIYVFKNFESSAFSTEPDRNIQGNVGNEILKWNVSNNATIATYVHNILSQVTQWNVTWNIHGNVNNENWNLKMKYCE